LGHAPHSNAGPGRSAGTLGGRGSYGSSTRGRGSIPGAEQAFKPRDHQRRDARLESKRGGPAGMVQPPEPPDHVLDELARILIKEAERLEHDQQAEHGRQAS
jgi:hypothetical protein